MEPGEQVGGYQVVRQIGRGGMGAVFLAEHALLGRQAAIKALHPVYSNNDEIVQRFFNEARAAAAISDPGIVQIFDFGHHTDGTAYIVMELLDGEPLDKRLARCGRMSLEAALTTLRQVASSLGAAHARQIIHRDLKPENIFIVRDPEVAGGERAKILDFGIAKLVDDPRAKKTETSALIGTPMYMSPEQCRGAKNVDARTDVYSLGCVLYTLLVGEPPFEADNLGELIAQHLGEQAPRASSRVMLPPHIDALIVRCLEKDPAKRFANGTELAAALGAAGAQQVPGRVSEILAVPELARGSALGLETVLTLPPRRKETTLSAAASSLVVHAAPSTQVPVRKKKAIVGIALLGVGIVAAVVTTIVVVDRGDKTSAPPVAAAAPAKPIVEPITAPVPPALAPNVAATRAQIGSVLAGFVRWSANHRGDACPSHGELGAVVDGGLEDVWGHPLVVTCTAQPDDQMIGVISLGPDGVVNTADDIVSWQLDAVVVSLVKGARWTHHSRPAATVHAAPTPAPVKQVAVKVKVEAPAPKAEPAVVPAPKTDPKKPTFHGTPLDDNGIPTRR